MTRGFLQMGRWRSWGMLALGLALAGASGAWSDGRQDPTAAAPGRPARDERPPRDTRPPIPEGVAATPATAYWPTPSEVRSGRQASGEVSKEYQIITEGPQYERLQRVSRAIVASVQSPETAAAYVKHYHVQLQPSADGPKRVPFEFDFKLVKTKSGAREVNAFSFAGGPVFVSTDLMDYARSDHELAAVLAHECTHVTYHHVIHMVSRQAKAQKGMLWGALAAVLLGATTGAGDTALAGMYGSQLYGIAKLTGYGRDLEREADHVGIDLMTRTSYSPVGMLTFMKKLARDDARRGDEMGIYQSHPYSSERVALIEAHLKELKIAFDPSTQRRIGNAFQVEVRPVDVDGRRMGEIRLNGNLVIRLAAAEGERTPVQRAQAAGREMDDLFVQRVGTIRDLRLADDGVTLVARGRPLLRVLPGDAEGTGRTPAQLAADALRAIQTEFWKERLDDLY